MHPNRLLDMYVKRMRKVALRQFTVALNSRRKKGELEFSHKGPLSGSMLPGRTISESVLPLTAWPHC